MDGLRGFACLTVFLANFHNAMGMNVSGRAGPFDAAVFAESGIGVALFLALSGALLSLPFWRALSGRGPGVRAGSFLVRRFLRLAPPYYLCLLAFLAAGGLWRDPADAAAHFLFVNNLGERWFYGVSPQLWTIGLFAQLALLVPLLFIALGRLASSRGAAAAWIAAAAAAAYGLHALLMATRHAWIAGPLAAVADPDGFVLSHSTLAHAPHFLLGVLAGLAIVREESSFGAARVRTGPNIADLVFWPAFIALIALAALPSAEEATLPYGRYLLPWMPMLAAATVASAPFGRAARGVLEIAPLRQLGVISYGIYIFHVPCMEVVRRLLGSVGSSTAAKLEFGAIGLGLTIVVAIASWLLVERPILRWSHRP